MKTGPTKLVLVESTDSIENNVRMLARLREILGFVKDIIGHGGGSLPWDHNYPL